MPLPLLGFAVGGIASLVSFIVRHPFVSKMMIFTVFTGLISLAVSYMQDMVSPYIVDNSLFAMAAYLGLLDAISLLLTIVLAGFGMKQVLAFIRS